MTRMLINMNGTGARELLQQQVAVRDAAAALKEALSAAYPNGRDFQTVRDPKAHGEEVEANRAAWRAVAAIGDHASLSLEALVDQPAGEKAWKEMRG